MTNQRRDPSSTTSSSNTSSADASSAEHADPSAGQDRPSAKEAAEDSSTVQPADDGTTSIERAERAAKLAAPEEASVPLKFEADELPRALGHASDEDLDKAAFGIIRLDEDGMIQFYNKFEQRLSGYSRDETIGKSFYQEIAPCTDSERFSEKFFKGVERGELDEMFTYTFTYRMEPLIVKIRLLEDTEGRYYVLVDAMR